MEKLPTEPTSLDAPVQPSTGSGVAPSRSGSAELAPVEGGADPEPSRRASITGPLPERTPHPGTMLERWGILGRLLARLFFAAVFFPVEAVQLIRQAASQGTVVYVLRMRNTVEFLYFNYAFLAHGLPLARFANGVRLLLFQPLGALLRRLFGVAARHDGLEVLRRLTRARRSSAVFLRTPPGLIPPTEFEGPYLQSLVELQRELDRPIMLVPLTVIWGRQPVRPVQGPLQPLFDPLFGDQDEPRLLRRLWQVLRHARRSLAVVCPPLNLREFLAARGSTVPAALVGELDTELLRRIESERRLKLGPPRAHPLEIRRSVLETPRVREAIAQRAQTSGASPERVRRQATRILQRMQAGMTPRGLIRLSWVVRKVWHRLFAGFEVDETGMARVQQLGRLGPLIFLPTHRSHLDYLIMSDLCVARDMVPPHIAAGINLSFWPMGWIFRTCGAFFLRRSVQGDDLYASLLSEYLSAILREGHNIEIFIEGGRSRSGQVLPPKLGLLSVVADLAVRGEVPPVHLVPASIGYDRVLEAASLTRELSGGAKRPESVAGILRAARVLRDRYGYVNVQFGEPIEVQSFLRERGYQQPQAAPEVRRRAIRSLGFHANARAGAVTAITPTSLCAAGLLVPGTRGVQQQNLLATIELLARTARLGGARFTALLKEGQPLTLDEETLREAIDLLARDGGIRWTGKGGETVFVIENEARLRLEYYKNQILQHLLDAAMLALVLRALEPEEGELQNRHALDRAHRFVVRLLKPHLVHRAGEARLRLLSSGEQRLLELGLISREPDGLRVRRESHLALARLAALLEAVVEGCGACARALLVLRSGPLLRRTLEQEVIDQLQRWNLTGEIRRSEACHTGLVHVCVDWLCQEGALVQQGEGAGREVGMAPAQADGAALELISRRAERLLPRRLATA